MKRRKIHRPVVRRIQIAAGGHIVKTIKRQLTIAAALRELGGDPVGNEGRLMSGDTIRIRRRIVRGVLVMLEYTADHSPTAEGGVTTWTTDLATCRQVIRAELAP